MREAASKRGVEAAATGPAATAPARARAAGLLSAPHRRPLVAAASSSALLLLLILALLAPTPAVAGCGRGDLPCFCKQAGGWWETPPSPLMPTCKVKFSHQGRDR